MESFAALRVTQQGPELKQLARPEVGKPEAGNNVLVRVLYSSLNYKDALALSGHSGILAALPMTAGIDLAGEVLSDPTGSFAKGTAVVLTGYGTGERRDGGYAELALCASEHLLPLSELGLSPRESMVQGTAGLTAALAALLLERQLAELRGKEVLVTGASGGVGSLGVALLSRLGCVVTASTGRPQHAPLLKALGAEQVCGRLSEGRPLERGQWDGVLDTVGGQTLSAALSQTRPAGAVAACGNAGGNRFEASVFPLILRGVALLGTDSNTAPRDLRLRAWRLLAQKGAKEADLAPLGLLSEVGLSELPAAAERLLAGKLRGRTLVRLS